MPEHPVPVRGSVDDELARAIGSTVGDDGSGPHLDRGRVREVIGLARRSAAAAGARAVTSGRWLAAVSVDVAEHLPVRDLPTLQEHHGDLAGALLSGPLIRNASRASAAVGATTGALAAASQTTPVTWAAMPVELAAETLIVVAIEMKLAGELHEAAGFPLARDLRRSGPLIARAWSETRGIDPADLASLLRPGGRAAAAGAASDLLGRSARDQLLNQVQRRLLRRAARNTVSFVPLMAGAVVGGAFNQRATRRFGLSVARSLHITPP